jgi:hypothetical protein
LNSANWDIRTTTTECKSRSGSSDMPLLGRTTRRLLRTVGGKPHSSEEDHADPLPTPPASDSTRSSMPGTTIDADEEDIFREPDSSEDEQETASKPSVANGFRTAATVNIHNQSVQHSAFKTAVQVETSESDGNVRRSQRSSFKQPQSAVELDQTTQHSASTKRTFQQPRTVESPDSTSGTHGNPDQQSSGDDDAMFFSSQGSSKRHKNLHAVPGYGKQGKQRRQRRKDETTQRARRLEQEAKAKEQAKPTFAMPKSVDMFEFGQQPQWRHWMDVQANPANTTTDLPSSPTSSLSSAPSDIETQDITSLALPDVGPYIPLVECTICHKHVNRFLREDFESEFALQGQMSFKWQKRFCIYHKQSEGREQWEERQYPQIEWSGLEKRMRRHRSHLLAIVNGTRNSVHKAKLEQEQKEGYKTIIQARNSDLAKKRACVGYYGPRGEKAM